MFFELVFRENSSLRFLFGVKLKGSYLRRPVDTAGIKFNSVLKAHVAMNKPSLTLG